MKVLTSARSWTTTRPSTRNWISRRTPISPVPSPNSLTTRTNLPRTPAPCPSGSFPKCANAAPPLRSVVKAQTNCSAATSPIAPTCWRADSPPAGTRGAARAPAIASGPFRTKRSLRIQGQAFPRRQPHAAGARARFLERHVLRCRRSASLCKLHCPHATEFSAAARKIHRRGSYAPFLWFDQKYFLARRYSHQGGSHEHGSFRGGAPAVSGSSHRGIRGHAAVVLQDSGLAAEGDSQRFDAGKLPQSVLRRKKVGFDIPAHEWLRGPLRHMLKDTVGAGVAQNPGFSGRRLCNRFCKPIWTGALILGIICGG